MFTIGDFARHGQVSVRMLRHYDATGLLRPARVDPASGYRFYEAGRLARPDRGRRVLAGAGRGEARDHRDGGRHASAAHLEPAFISPVIQPLYEELGSRLGRAGVVPAGPAIAYYEDAPDGDGVIIHASMPVSAGPVYLDCPEDRDKWATELQEPITPG